MIFFFTLPKIQPLAIESPLLADAGLADGRKAGVENRTLANVLLVDDREADIELTKVMLFNRNPMQCNVTIAHDGEEAHGILKEKNQKEDRIDLVLLDINMPRMDGFELLEQMRKDVALKDTAVVMCTGSTYEQDRQRAKSLGAIGYLVKPVSFDKLRPLLEHLPALRLQMQGKGSTLMRSA